MRELSDKEILKLFIDRDERAIEECRKAYGKVCGSTAVNILKNKQDAEEALNDAYLEAWNTVHIKRPDALLPYLVSLTRNISVSKLRALTAEKRMAVKIPLDELAEVLPDSRNTENAYDSRRLGELINGFVKSMPERDRRVFILRYYANYSIRETAKKLGMTDGAVKMSLGRTKKKLKQQLESNGYHNE